MDEIKGMYNVKDLIMWKNLSQLLSSYLPTPLYTHPVLENRVSAK